MQIAPLLPWAYTFAQSGNSFDFYLQQSVFASRPLTFFRQLEGRKMPIYEYRALSETSCGHCENGFECLQKLNDAPLAFCPQCKQAIRRVISAPSLAKPEVSLERSNLEKHGFTRYEKAEKGVYEKTAGMGPSLLKDS